MSKHTQNAQPVFNTKSPKHSYAEEIKIQLNDAAKKLPADVEKTEPLAFLNYEDEIKIKHSSLNKFLRKLSD